MNKKKTSKLSAGPMMAMMVAVMMVLCAFSPALATYNNGGDVYAESDPDYSAGGDVSYKYVSLGDSVTNGYGMFDYYANADGTSSGSVLNAWPNDYSYGLHAEAANAYPSKILNEYLGEGWDLVQLAISGLRIDEIRWLLDDDFYNEYPMGPDTYTLGASHFVNSMGHWEYDGCTHTETCCIDCFREYYQEQIAEAGFITMNFGYNNFGTFITYPIGKYLETGSTGNFHKFSFSTYLNDGGFVDELFADLFDTVLYELFAGSGDEQSLTATMAKVQILINDYKQNPESVKAEIEKMFNDAVEANNGDVAGAIIFVLNNAGEEYEAWASAYQQRVHEFLAVLPYTEYAKIAEIADVVEYLVTALVYGAVSHISNYEATMEWILENNEMSNLQIVVLGVDNVVENLELSLESLLGEGAAVSVGGLYGILTDIVNMYMQYLSPANYDPRVVYVEPPEVETYFGQFAEGKEVSSEFWFLILKDFGMYYHDEYCHPETCDHLVKLVPILNNALESLPESLPEVDISENLLLDKGGLNAEVLFTTKGMNTLASDLLSYAANLSISFETVNVGDLVLLTEGGYNALTYAVKPENPLAPLAVLIKTVYDVFYTLYSVENVIRDAYNYTSLDIGFLLNGVDVGNISADMMDGEVDPEYYPLIRFYIENMAANSLGIHPDANGHQNIYDAIVAGIEKDALQQAAMDEYIASLAASLNQNANVSVYGDPSYIHAEPAYICGTVINLGDSNARGTGLEDYDFSYDNLVAEALGINPETQLYDYAYPGLRIQDIRAIFDEGVVLDGYGADFEDYIANARENIQDFADVDLIILNAGGNNFRYVTVQINNYLEGKEIYEMDFNQISFLDDETKTDIMTMQFLMDTILSNIEDEDLRFKMGLMSVAVQAAAYGYLTFVDNYIPTVKMIQSINPDVQIVNIGVCNQYNGLYFDNGCVKFDVGALLGSGIGFYNKHIEQFADVTGTIYVDIFDADTLATEVSKAEGWANICITDENGVPLAYYYYAGDVRYGHPSLNGHAFIAEQIMAALDGFTMPGHIMGEWFVVEEPKEGVEGTQVRYCDVCGAEEYGTIPALEHVCVPGTELFKDESGHWYQCVCGEKFEIFEHEYVFNYQDLSGHYSVCSDCGYIGDFVNHDWADAGQDGVSYCECGASHDCYLLNRYVPHETGHWHECAICGDHDEVVAHDIKVENDKNLHWDHCEICGYYSEKVNHVMGDWTVVTPAEEGKDGEKERQCTGCTYTETEVIPALDHVCEPGTEWFYDENGHWHVCACTLKHDVGNHNITVEFGEMTHWNFCDICQYTSEEYLHIMGDWTITVEPSADAEGEKERHCTGCDYTETEAIPRGETETDSEGNTTTVVVTPEGDVITTTVKTDGTVIEHIERTNGETVLLTKNTDGSSIYEYTLVEVINNGEAVSDFYMEINSQGVITNYESSFEWTSFDGTVISNASVDSEDGVDMNSEITIVMNVAGSDVPVDLTDAIDNALAMAEEHVREFNATGVPDLVTIEVIIDDMDIDVEISPYVLSMISDAENASFILKSDVSAILINDDVALSLAGHGDKIGISMQEADYSELTEDQLKAIGDRTLISIEASAGGNAIHNLGGQVTIALYDYDESITNPVVCYLDENGKLVSLETMYYPGAGIVFITDHFSYFAVMDKSDLDSVFIIDAFGWVLVGIMVLIGLAVVFLRKN